MKNNLPQGKIERQLKKLVGLRVWGPGLAAGMLTVSFGDRHSATTRKGKKIEVGDYALHIQCAWRLARNNAVAVGFADYVAIEDEKEALTKFTAVLKKELSKSPIVKAISYVRGGAFSLVLEDGLYLEAFPSLSISDSDKEFWRIFRPHQSSTHFVVTPAGIENDG